MALGQLYHQSCFVCNKCHQPFPDGAFYQHENQLLCETDFNELAFEKCAKCTKPIDGECFNALDKKFHPNCFRCQRCDMALKGGFLRFDEKPYCRTCHDIVVKEEQEILANSCYRCKKRIDGPPFLYRGNKYHAFHFNCTTCKLELGPDCKEHEGKLYCPEDYARAIAPACFACKKLIFGQVIQSMGKAFHADHFVCAKCESRFSDGIFYEHLGQALCELHFREATGTRCARCKCVIQGDVVEAAGKQWCANHFVCAGCDKSLAGDSYGDWDGRAICAGCFTKLPTKVRKRLNDHRIHVEKRYKAKNGNKTSGSKMNLNGPNGKSSGSKVNLSGGAGGSRGNLNGSRAQLGGSRPGLHGQ
ncbi:hypothetical protein BCR44DRAFT_127286 [Catenaria anguillulae PL171]|uniref:LIM zinc-binding domain-containing protein n=1 Tax=Catenaria anguillulae PL171 TaxID=765915 RepID=A0A1Y2HNP4_9FUNG|nr:hypothetical protein BCR44DRAFT_127286 [Catenaria anguillulae PL171]